MKKLDFIAKIVIVLFFINGCTSTDSKKDEAKPETDFVETRIGTLDFTHGFEKGYPKDKTVELLFNEMDFQRACQAYIWATPLVGFAEFQHSLQNELGIGNGQFILQESYRDKIGGLTYNTVTPYAITFVNVEKQPWIIEIPEGEVRGALHNMWQIGLQQMTKPGKYLLVGPESEVPANAKDYVVVKSNTNNNCLGIRLMSSDKGERKIVLGSINIYPYSEKESPNPRGFKEADGTYWMSAAPRGLGYWERLSAIINTNGPVHERDRLFMAMLKPLGIERGKEFNPTPEQEKILTEASLVGESMTKAIDFAGTDRIEGAHYADDSTWEIATTSPPDQRHEDYEALDGRAAWFYEAITNDIAMHGLVNGGWGQVYLTAYKDNDGDWLDGGENYRLHLPSNPPVENFWSITLYEVNTRTIIKNTTEKADLSSRQNIEINEDGSIDLYFGPETPKGKERNWVQTEAGRAWFPYFRFYSPTKAAVERTWVLPDIEKIIR